jgi:hypothetical protein
MLNNDWNYYRKQLMMAELLLHFKVIQDREEFYKKYENRFRSIFYKQNGKVCVNDLLN